jgi:hypothetical protein
MCQMFRPVAHVTGCDIWVWSIDNSCHEKVEVSQKNTCLTATLPDSGTKSSLRD